MIDLHCHTTASDGTYPPAEVVRLAARAGVRTLAISDHDTVDGIAEAREEASRQKIRLVPGAEISAALDDREIHILGHFIDPEDPTLIQRLATFREGRALRARQMVERLQAEGIDLHFEEVAALAGAPGSSIGRPHFARLLVAKKVARDFQDAFDRWLGKGMPGWAPRQLPDAAEVIELIRAAGGVSSLAHPTLSGVSGVEMERLAEQGLNALEIGHPGQNADSRRRLRAFASALGLHQTAGSDFHGDHQRFGSETMDEAALLAYEAAVSV